MSSTESASRPFQSLPEEDRWGHHLGLEIVEVTESGVKATLEAGPKHQQPMGILHGGAWCSIVETAASYGAGFLAMSRGATGVVGVSNQTDFLRSHSEGLLEVDAHPLHAGRRTHVWEVLITRPSDGALVARGQVRFQILDEMPSDRTSANAPKENPMKTSGGNL
jgi:1,4-dihydroxy-2-naphthoyl-CoA hydrolase